MVAAAAAVGGDGYGGGGRDGSVGMAIVLTVVGLVVGRR